MKAILLGAESCQHVEVLRAKLETSWDLRTIEQYEPGVHLDQFATADALISVRFDESFPPMTALKLMQAPATGVNSIQFDTVPADVPICNSYGHEIAIAEYTVLAMLACAHNIVKIQEEFVRGKWNWKEVAVHPAHSEIYGKTVCLIGLGRIGRETAKRAKALGMYVIGCNRTTGSEIPNVDEIAGLSSIADQVSQADFVVTACALAEETRNIIDRGVLGAMKSSAFIINVGRGLLINEEDLYDALLKRRIAGAVLDAWYRYPTRENSNPAPSALPFYQLNNVILTPHISGWTDGMIDRRWADIARNLDSLSLGRALINVVRPRRSSASA
jgi:phosphoglycerate dehydrogenase-like enzyme